MRKPKYLIETSACIAALGWSTEEHNQHVRIALSEGSLASSIYVRKEFIRRFVCDGIRIAEDISRASSPDQALLNEAEGYGRGPKAVANMVAWILKKVGTIRNTHELALDVCDIVIDLLDEFDDVLERRIQNSSGCTKGDYQFQVDYCRRPVRQLSDQRREFLKDVVDCQVNSFLQINMPSGRGRRLLARPEIQSTAKITKAIFDPLSGVLNAEGQITCSSCCKIGDPIIAMEQPNSHCLVHIDHSFDVLCLINSKEHLRLPGRIALRPKH